jgi:hypothetical protein
MAWDNYERLLRLERIAIDLESAVDRNGLELIYLRDKIRESWQETEAEAGGPPSHSNLNGVLTGCGGLLLCGATVTVTIGTDTFSVVTGLDGAFSFGDLPAGSTTVTATHPRFTGTATLWTGTLTGTGTTNVGTVAIGLSVASGYVCQATLCGLPIPTTLVFKWAKVATGTVVDVTAIYDATNNWWYGCVMELGRGLGNVTQDNAQCALGSPANVHHGVETATDIYLWRNTSVPRWELQPLQDLCPATGIPLERNCGTNIQTPTVGAPAIPLASWDCCPPFQAYSSTPALIVAES